MQIFYALLVKILVFLVLLQPGLIQKSNSLEFSEASSHASGFTIAILIPVYSSQYSLFYKTGGSSDNTATVASLGSYCTLLL